MSNMKRRQGDRVKFRIGGFGSEMWGKICGHATRDIPELGVGWIVELDEKFPDYEYTHVVIHDAWIYAVAGLDLKENEVNKENVSISHGPDYPVPSEVVKTLSDRRFEMTIKYSPEAIQWVIKNMGLTPAQYAENMLDPFREELIHMVNRALAEGEEEENE